MFFYRGKTHTPAKRSTALMRIATIAALVTYPLGCIIRLVYPDTTPEPGLTAGEAVGFAFILMALAAFCVIAPSQLQRIVGEESKNLDEFEMDLRRKAYSFGYWAMSGILVLGVMYMGVATDTDADSLFTLWKPQTHDHWNAIFWGALLYAVVMPTTYLAWAGPAPLDDDDAELAHE